MQIDDSSDNRIRVRNKVSVIHVNPGYDLLNIETHESQVPIIHIPPPWQNRYHNRISCGIWEPSLRTVTRSNWGGILISMTTDIINRWAVSFREKEKESSNESGMPNIDRWMKRYLEK